MEQFKKDVRELLAIELTDRQLEAFRIYENELLKWNEQFNLTAIRDQKGVRTKHFLDSLSCLLVLKNGAPRSMIDIGSGAGFPGIPLKILKPNLKLTLVESIGKKTKFCTHIINELGLQDVTIVQARAEDIGHFQVHRENYDWALARAVANLPTLVEYLLPFVKVGGVVIAQKGDTGPAEAHHAERAIKLMGGQLRHLMGLNLPGVVEDRYLIVIDKICATPPKFPRRAGIPAKKPIV